MLNILTLKGEIVRFGYTFSLPHCFKLNSESIQWAKSKPQNPKTPKPHEYDLIAWIYSAFVDVCLVVAGVRDSLFFININAKTSITRQKGIIALSAPKR